MYYVKIESLDVAKALETVGFTYTVETVNRKSFYCFEHTEDLAKVIMTKFADARIVIDDRLRF